MMPTRPAPVVTTASNNDRDILARILYGEARGEGRAGLIAVASVTLNRQRLPTPRSPKRQSGSCLTPFQAQSIFGPTQSFEVKNDGAPYRCGEV
jgi:hypothetical protein